MIPLIARTCAGRVEIVSRSDSDSSAFRMAALLMDRKRYSGRARLKASVPDRRAFFKTLIDV
jgi:hypothetical protein